jgi:nitrate reductase gamma subunit
MNWNLLLFVIFPYVALALAVVVTIVRWRTRPFTISSLSSQLFERRKLFWGSISFHWGIVLILLGHLTALVVPSAFELWNRVPLRLYLTEITGLALGIWMLAGLLFLIYRRLSEPKVRAVTSIMDLVVLIVLAVQVVTGLWVALGYRFGSFWGPTVMAPYVRSLLLLEPRPELVANLPIAVKLHTSAFFVFLLVFPFSRLVHIITVPLGYLTRPWQIVLRLRPARGRVP